MVLVGDIGSTRIGLGWQTAPRMAAARELVIADEPAAWAALGFALGEDGAFALGGLRVRLAGAGAGRGVAEVRVDGLLAHGIRTRSALNGPARQAGSRPVASIAT
jgi:hypothetical protein